MTTTQTQQPRAYTVAAAARILNVSNTQVRRWIEDGTLREDTSIAGKGRYATGASVRRLKAERQVASHETADSLAD